MNTNNIALHPENEPAPLSVRAFVASLNTLLAEQVVWVEGEVADLRFSKGKFIYFALKDDDALLNCFALQFRVRVPLEEGMKIRVWGVPQVYAKFGKLSLNIEKVELSGEGTLKRAYELLKATLTKEGLFAPDRKRPLPRFPERIGLLTSPDAAAYTDFLKVLTERRGGMEILFAPTLVQGREAPDHIVQALALLNEQEQPLDVIVLVRGGGSLEDLHAFNDERVVRAIARSRIPVLIGVGHERDVTLADFAADVRASTPSNAAQLLTPTKESLLRDIAVLQDRLRTTVWSTLSYHQDVCARSVTLLRESLHRSLLLFHSTAQRMQHVSQLFSQAVSTKRDRIVRSLRTLQHEYTAARQETREHIRTAERLLESLHPLRVLARGYSITRGSNGHVIYDPRDVPEGSVIKTLLARGTLTSHTSPCPPNQQISRKPMKNSKKSLPPSNQATLI